VPEELSVRTDWEGRFTFVNDAFCRKHGLAREDLIGGKSFMQLVLDEELPRTLSAAPPAAGQLRRPAGASPIGTRAGGYILRRLIGHGGMGNVYLAENREIGRRAAVKILHDQFRAQPEIARRFFDEARAVNRIRHENILAILDLATLPDGAYYILMELLEGETLKSFIKRAKRVEPAAAGALGLQILAGLAATHAEGIVHRDLKPANVFLTHGKTGVLVKILDFGVAKLSEPGDAQTTSAGSVLGTPAYMAPEQAAGRTTEVDGRADLYALGVLLYELLTGRTPFLAAGVAELYHDQMLRAPDPPSTHAVELSRDVDAFVLKALQKRREDRFQTAREMAAALAEATGAHSEGLDLAIEVELAATAPPPGAGPLSGGTTVVGIDVTFSPISEPGSVVYTTAEVPPANDGRTRGRVHWVAGAAAAALVLLGLGGVALRGWGLSGRGADDEVSAKAADGERAPGVDGTAPATATAPSAAAMTGTSAALVPESAPTVAATATATASGADAPATSRAKAKSAKKKVRKKLAPRDAPADL
jgi:serine/threonine-protein kinase